jgi:hypothetical protein
MLGTALLLFSCDAKINNKYVVGTWTNTLNGGAKIHFLDNGRFTFVNLPAKLLKSSDDGKGPRVSGEGWWNIDFKDPSIELRFEWIEAIKDRPVEMLYVSQVGPWTQIYFDQVSGVEDSIAGRYVFEKEQQAAPATPKQ